MSQTSPRLKPLEVRKELLIAESEINRGQLAEQWQAMTAGFHKATARVKSAGLIASAAAMIMAGVSAFRPKSDSQHNAEGSWVQSLLKGAGLVSSVWMAFRSRGCGRKLNRNSKGIYVTKY